MKTEASVFTGFDLCTRQQKTWKMTGDRILRRRGALARCLEVSANDLGCPRLRLTGICFIVNGRGIFYVYTAAELAEQLKWWRPRGVEFLKIYDECGREYFVYKGR